MQYRAKQIGKPWRGLAIAAWTLMLSTGSPLQAQLKFFAPANQPPSANGPALSSPGTVPAAAPDSAAADATQPGQPEQMVGEVDDAVMVTAAQSELPALAIPDAANEALGVGADLPPAPPAEVLQAPPTTTTVPSAPMAGSAPITIGPGFEQPMDHMLMEGQPALLYSSGSWFRRGFWYSHADATFILRTGLNPDIFATDQSFKTTSTTTGEEIDVGLETRPMLGSSTVAPTYEPGVRFTLGRMLGQDNTNRDYAFEASFLGLLEYSEFAALASVDARGLETALAPGAEYRFGTGVVNSSFTGFSETSLQTLRYDTDFNSGELNFRIAGRPLRDRMLLQPNGNWVRHGSSSLLKTFIVGARYASINDRMLYTAFELPEDATPSGELEVATHNHMFGMQIGIEIIENYTNWSWGARFKAAGMYNFADRDSRLLQTAEDLGERRESVDRNNLAPFLDGGLVASYQLRPNISLHASYDMMYVTGIANAMENARLGDRFPDFEVTGDAFFHGLSVGFETLW